MRSSLWQDYKAQRAGRLAAGQALAVAGACAAAGQRGVGQRGVGQISPAILQSLNPNLLRPRTGVSSSVMRGIQMGLGRNPTLQNAIARAAQGDDDDLPPELYLNWDTGSVAAAASSTQTPSPSIAVIPKRLSIDAATAVFGEITALSIGRLNLLANGVAMAATMFSTETYPDGRPLGNGDVLVPGVQASITIKNRDGSAHRFMGTWFVDNVGGSC